ncbi:DUF2505 domain-containing protein [Nocardioides lentus]|uniref:DUF2505 domain-containing protein n=1 Tax=Nocardioides lentus TaxID=338077 RepID=A0ABP5AS07_9ACTN
MATRLTHDMPYDATPEQVSAMLDDVAFREAVCDRQGATHHEVSIDGDDVRVEFGRRTRGLPGYATKIVGDEVTIVQTETWTSPTHADIRLEIPGKPGDVSGTIDLAEADGGGCVETVVFDIRVKVPVVGGKIEGLLKDMIRDGLRKEHEVGRERLG